MKKLILCVIFLNLALIGYTQELLVAVTDFTARSGYSEEELANITELFATFLQNTGKVKVLTRSQWEAILKEHAFQRSSGFVAQTEIRQLGEALGAQGVVTGTLMKMGRINVLNINILDIVSGEMLSATARRYESLEEFLDLLPALAVDIVKLLEKPSPLLGKWKVDGQAIVVEFNENGTLEVQNTVFCNELKQINTITTRDGKTGYKFEYRYFSGNIRGKYSYTASEITVSGNFSGTIYRTEIWNDYSGRYRIATNNGTESFINSFKYKLIDRKTLELINCLFLQYDFSFTNNRWTWRYHTRLTKIE